MAEGVLFEKRGPIAVITLDRPDVLNAMRPDGFLEVERCMDAFDQDPALLVAILTGSGDRAFCVGADLKSGIQQVLDAGAKRVVPDPSKRFFSSVSKPIIAAVNGLCVAGGMEMLLGTDIRVAADHAMFGITEAQWGLLPFGGGTVRLARQIPWAVAMEMLLLGEKLSASDARHYGLINHVVAADALMGRAMALADRIAANGPISVRRIKQVMIETHTMPWRQAFEAEFLAGQEVMQSDDADEGIRAFIERRPPRFRGR